MKMNLTGPVLILLAVLALALPLAGGTVVYIIMRGHSGEPKGGFQRDVALPTVPVSKPALDPPQGDPKNEVVQVHFKESNGQGPANPPQWEYKVMAMQPLDVRRLGSSVDYDKQADIYTESFNKLAKDGWEFHSFVQSASAFYNIPGDFVLFKRPKTKE
jgi:hypothetical protein